LYADDSIFGGIGANIPLVPPSKGETNADYFFITHLRFDEHTLLSAIFVSFVFFVVYSVILSTKVSAPSAISAVEKRSA
jgi:hypothetical protein